MRLLVDRDRTSTGHCHYGLGTQFGGGNVLFEVRCFERKPRGGFFFLKQFFLSLFGEMIQFEEHVFSNGLKPPISEKTSLKLFAPVERRERI